MRGSSRVGFIPTVFSHRRPRYHSYMPNYRRAYHLGGTFFLTLVTHQRASLFSCSRARQCLRDSIVLTRKDRNLKLIASVLLPDHLHLIIELSSEDADFSSCVGAIKGRFSRRWLTMGGEELDQSDSRKRQGYRGVWQKRFWEHQIRDGQDLIRCCDYIHYNPVKHGLVSCPHAWEWSTFHRLVREGRYSTDWCCSCNAPQRPCLPMDVPGAEMD